MNVGGDEIKSANNKAWLKVATPHVLAKYNWAGTQRKDRAAKGKLKKPVKDLKITELLYGMQHISFILLNLKKNMKNSTISSFYRSSSSDSSCEWQVYL